MNKYSYQVTFTYSEAIRLIREGWELYAWPYSGTDRTRYAFKKENHGVV